MQAASSLCSTFRANWRVLPAVLSVVASVVALIAALHFHSYYLSIPAGVGVLCGIYAFSLALDFQNLKTLEEQNRLFAARVLELEKVKIALAEEVQELKTLRTKLTATATDLQTKVEDLQSKLTQMETVKNRLQKLHDDLAQDREKHLLQLETIEKSLQSQGDAVFQNLSHVLQHFKDHLVFFQSENERLQTSTTTIVDKTRGLEASLETYISNLQSFEKNKADMMRMLAVLSGLTKQQSEQAQQCKALTREQSELTHSISTLQAQLKERQQELETTTTRLKETHKQYEETLAKYKTLIPQIESALAKKHQTSNAVGDMQQMV